MDSLFMGRLHLEERRKRRIWDENESIKANGTGLTS
jgi:hypothetical protein